MTLIGIAFTALGCYLAIQSSWALVSGFRPAQSVLGNALTAVTALVMFGLAHDNARTGRALDNAVLRTEGRVTAVDGLLAVAVLAGLALNTALRRLVGRPPRRIRPYLLRRARSPCDLYQRPPRLT